MSEQELKPITPERVVQELRKLSEGRKSGQYDGDEYEHRFARMVSELRDRRIEGSRAQIMAALEPLKLDGTLDPKAYLRLTKSLGLG
ncbi:MAG TPA: hypothetical protein VFN96_03245 [Gemmatimonadales bacterium]|nr:hypothetical protein [Gemmatimonadales bacterium]